MSSPYKVESPAFGNPYIFCNPQRIHHCKLQVTAMISVPSKVPSLISTDRGSIDLVQGRKLESLQFDERTGRIRVEDILDKIKAIPFKDAIEIFRIMEKDAGNWTLSDFNDLLMALVTANESDLALELYSNVASSGLALPLNCWTFSIMIRCCCKKNDLDEAQRVLHHMVKNGYSPNVITFTTLIHSLCKRGKLQNAFEVFAVMGRIGCKPTKKTIRPDIYSYTAVMDGFCKVGRSNEAMELLNQAQEVGLVLNVVTFNTLFTGYNKEGRPQQGFRVLKLMKEKNCMPDSISYSTLLSGLLKWGKIRAALRVYKEMVAIGFEVDGKMMSTLLRGLCMNSWKEKDLIQDAYQVFDKMKSGVSIIDHSTHGFVIRTLSMGKKLEEALEHLQEMIRMGYIPRTITFNNVIQAFCLEGKIREALVVLVIMYENGKIPSRTSYDSLVKEFNQQGRLLGACNVYGAALKQGVVPHRIPLG
ncbi:hypothetical protein REPUB_Repub15cG0146300 [Reevesia pubescens]